jgi:uridine phosphorylase
VFGRLEEIWEVHLSRVANRVGGVPRRLRPKAALAPDAILVGDPGRSLLLAQELLEKPVMSNHARGLWGYSGRTPAGDELTIQATGMGGPSAAAVLSDLAELGVRRAVRVGTCSGLDPQAQVGELLLAAEAVAAGGSATAFGIRPGEALEPDPGLFERLCEELAGLARTARVASFDTMPADASAVAAAADMQTAAVLARGPQLGMATAAVLIVTELRAGSERLSDDALEEAAKRAGRAATVVLSG